MLRRVDDHLEVISNGVFLMDTRDGRSERLLVTAALDRHPDASTVLIGGLGVGFSLVEAVACERLRRITVVELEPAVVDWHAGPLATVSGDAMADPRVQVVVEDVATHLRAVDPRYDVICLDVDNGPDWTVTDANAALYGDAGTDLLAGALAPEGVLAVWSARPAPAYERRLRSRFATVTALPVDVPRGEPDVVYVAERPAVRS